MSKFVFIVPPLNGHINPTLGVGKELLQRGHKVAWIGFDPSLEGRLPKGGEFLLIPTEMSEEEKERQTEHLMSLSTKSVYGLDSLKFLYDEVLIPMNDFVLGKLDKILDGFQPDVVISDHQVFAGAIAAIKKNIPYVTSITAPAAIKVNDNLPQVYQWEGDQIVAFQQKQGIEGDERLDCSPILNLVYTSQLFFGDQKMPDHFKFIGPVISDRIQKIDFGWQALEAMGDRPKVLVSIGTTFDHNQKQKFFEKVVEALGDEDMTVVVISDSEIFRNIPDNFIIQKQIPQLEILPHMQLVICHGGHNTVCETLMQGVPLVVVPIAYDQSYVASCVTDNNAGIRLNFNRFKAIQLKDAVHTLLKEQAYAENARNVQKSFIAAGGVAKGVDYLESLLINH